MQAGLRIIPPIVKNIHNTKKTWQSFSQLYRMIFPVVLESQRFHDMSNLLSIFKSRYNEFLLTMSSFFYDVTFYHVWL